MSRLIDLTGQRFGNRLVLHRVPRPGQPAHWLVHCKCGKEDRVPSQRLRTGFKVSGRGREKWRMPEWPAWQGERLAGLLDSDGCVSADGRLISFYQNPHRGLDFVRESLNSLNIAFSTYRPEGKAEEVRILAGSRDDFKIVAKPRYPKKAQRSALPTPPRPRLHNLTGQRFENRVASRITMWLAWFGIGPEAATVWVLLVVACCFLPACKPIASVRNPNVYANEIDYNNMVQNQAVGHLKHWMEINCLCLNHEWVGDEAEACEKTAKHILVVETRQPWHTHAMEFNGNLRQDEPPELPPEIPEPTSLCPEAEKN